MITKNVEGILVAIANDGSKFFTEHEARAHDALLHIGKAIEESGHTMVTAAINDAEMLVPGTRRALQTILVRLGMYQSLALAKKPVKPDPRAPAPQPQPELPEGAQEPERTTRPDVQRDTPAHDAATGAVAAALEPGSPGVGLPDVALPPLTSDEPGVRGESFIDRIEKTLEKDLHLDGKGIANRVAQRMGEMKELVAK